MRFTGFILCFISFAGFSQTPFFSIKGRITNAKDGTIIKDATITVKSKSDNTVSNFFPDSSGNFNITGLKDSVDIAVSLVGYKLYHTSLLVNRNITLKVKLEANINELKTVEISDKLKQPLESRIGVETMSAATIKSLPVISGEADVIKSLQLRPGITSGIEGSSTLLVRGGSPDQNLIVYDGATIYNPNHIFGFLSVFNNDITKEVTIYKGGFPASFGGRLSSIVDVSTIKGNTDSLSVKGGIGLISSRIMVEGPIKKGKTSYAIAGRRSYFDLFAKQYNRKIESNSDFEPLPVYYLYDLNLKINHTFNNNNYLSISGYYGVDKYSIAKNYRNIDFNWGNRSIVLRWLHIFNGNVSLSTSAIYSGFTNVVSSSDPTSKLELNSVIADYSLKSDLSWFISNFLNIKTGLFATQNDYAISKLRNENVSSNGGLIAGENLKSYHFGYYVSDEIDIGEKFKVIPGMRFTVYKQGNSTFGSIEPRIQASYTFRKDFLWKAAYTRMYQFLHLISNPGVSLPTDIWYPSGDNVKPQYSDQVSIGISKSFFDGNLVINNEYYKKWLSNQIEFRDGSQIIVSKNYKELFVFGKGESYGAELSIEKPKGRATGWISYTIGQNWRTFKNINGGEPFHPNFDRRHNVAVVGVLNVSKKVKISTTWVFATGNYVSIPYARYLLLDVNSVNNPQSVPIYLSRNGYRMDNYHRLDFSFTYIFTPKWGESDLTISVYNVYNKANPYFIYVDAVRDDKNNIKYYQAKQVSLFPIIPAITYNFKF